MYSAERGGGCDSLASQMPRYRRRAWTGRRRSRGGPWQVQPPAVIVQGAMDARIRAERPALPEWLGRARTSGEIVVNEFEMLVPEACLTILVRMALNQRLDDA